MCKFRPTPGPQACAAKQGTKVSLGGIIDGKVLGKF